MSSDSTTIGAAAPPPGVVANFDNPESIAHRVMIVSVLGAVAAIPVCLIRVYTKRYILMNLGWDDYSIFLATVCLTITMSIVTLLNEDETFALGFSTYVGYQTTNCLGIHIWDCPASKFFALMKIGDIAGPILFNFATILTKISLGLFYLRVSPFQTCFRVAVYGVLCVSVVNGMLNAFGFAWVCQPIEKYWDFAIMTGKCIDLNQYFLAAACINAGTDLALLVLPIAILQKLQLPLRRKVSAALLLMTGSFVCVVSLIRVEQVVRGMTIVPTDGTWGMVGNFIWLLIEMWLGIICTCLPILYTFYRTQMVRKRQARQQGVLAVVRDPNSRREGIEVPDDSGYHTGNSMAFTLHELDVERLDQRASNDGNIRPMASTKSLLVTAERCND